MGVALVALGRQEQGIQYLRESLEICRAIGRNWHLATSLLNLGRTVMRLGDMQEAQRLLGEALTVYQELGNQAFVARTEGYLGCGAAES